MRTRVGGRPWKEPLRPLDRERKSKKEGETIIRVRLFRKNSGGKSERRRISVLTISLKY